MTYLSDEHRHLVCTPYSVENLHEMARQLEIKRCWFHSGKLAHYDIPKRRVREIAEKTCVVSSREILEVIKSACKSVWSDTPARNREAAGSNPATQTIVTRQRQ